MSADSGHWAGGAGGSGEERGGEGGGGGGGGIVTTLHAEDLKAIRHAFLGELEPLDTACLRPEMAALESFALQMKKLYLDRYQEHVPLAEVCDSFICVK